MGEEPDKIFNVGCPSIDALLAETDNPSILSKYNLLPLRILEVTKVI